MDDTSDAVLSADVPEDPYRAGLFVEVRSRGNRTHRYLNALTVLHNAVFGDFVNPDDSLKLLLAKTGRSSFVEHLFHRM